MNPAANGNSGAGRQVQSPGGAVPGAQAALPISVRSRVNAPDRESTTNLRRKLLVRYSGRQMQRRLLDGAGFARDEVRARKCGFRLGDERTFLVGPDGRARVIAERCEQNRVCSVCGPARAAVRAAEVGTATWRWMTANDEHSAVFISTAASHRAGDSLEEHHNMWLHARGRVMRSRRWTRMRELLGVADVCWKIEHSIGPNGPHVGLHMILLTTRWWDSADADRAEAFLLLEFRRELAAAGFTGTLSASQGVDIRPVDDPEAVARYLAKWGVGQELAAESDKLGRNGVNVPLAAIPAILAEQLGRLDPYSPRVLRDPNTRRMVHGWSAYVRLAVSDKRKWYAGFHQLKQMVPELKGLTRPQEIIATCTELLPAELRPERFDDSEVGEDSEECDDAGAQLRVESDAWETCQMAWFRQDRLPWIWAVRRRHWLDGHAGAVIPLELAVMWTIEDEGLDIAAGALAKLCGGGICGDELGLTITAVAGSPIRRQDVG
jgi:hypothetical protein